MKLVRVARGPWHGPLLGATEAALRHHCPTSIERRVSWSGLILGPVVDQLEVVTGHPLGCFRSGPLDLAWGTYLLDRFAFGVLPGYALLIYSLREKIKKHGYQVWLQWCPTTLVHISMGPNGL